MAILAAVALTGCRDDDFSIDDVEMGPDGGVVFRVDIDNMEGTRGAVDLSKKGFVADELLHVRAVYHCRDNGREYTKLEYGVLRYKGNGTWEPYSDAYALRWPDDAVSGDFSAYYIYGSNGVLSEYTPDPKLLSDYNFDEIPLHCEVDNIGYGRAVKLQMKRLFSLLTLTDMKEGISDEFWFYVPEESNVSGRELNNAFQFVFNPETYEMTPVFKQIKSAEYTDRNGNPMAFVKSRLTQGEKDGIMATEINYLLEPGVYHQFNVLYPRGKNAYATYITYGRDLEVKTGPEGFVANGRYTFSILKSLGVIVTETPESGWDKEAPVIIVDVEAFLKALNSGSDYYEEDRNTHEMVQILEQTLEGTRLLHNIDFRYFPYDVFENGMFRPTLNNTFDGNYHYIYRMACPLVYENNGAIINLGIRQARTEAILSTERMMRYGEIYDNSYNGLISSINQGTVSNIRVIDCEMTVDVITSSPDEPTQEAHNVGLLFGVNRGSAFDIGIAENLRLTVRTAQGETLMPSVSIGGLAGQNLGTIYGVNYIEDDRETFGVPDLTVVNECRGENGVYRVGGVTGNNTGSLVDIFINNVDVDSSASDGLESYVGGITGENPTSANAAPRISGCIVRGTAKAGRVTPVLNLDAFSYTGGVAGSLNVQLILEDCSVSVGVTGSPFTSDEVEYAEGGVAGAIGRNAVYAEGTIYKLACYGSSLTGPGYKGDFAGIVAAGYGWSHYQDNEINLRKIVNQYVGLERGASGVRKKRK